MSATVLSGTGRPSRPDIVDAYVRVCRDLHFKVDAAEAARVTGVLLGIHPMEVWLEGLSLGDMQDIAAGTHRALKENGGKH